MNRLEERAGDCDWIAWEHRDHSNHDHVHVIAILDRRFSAAKHGPKQPDNRSRYLRKR